MRQKNLHLFFCIAYLLDWEFDSYTIHAIFFIMLIVHIFFLKRALLRISAWLNLYTQFRAPQYFKIPFDDYRKTLKKCLFKAGGTCGKIEKF